MLGWYAQVLQIRGIVIGPYIIGRGVRGCNAALAILVSVLVIASVKTEAQNIRYDVTVDDGGIMVAM